MGMLCAGNKTMKLVVMTGGGGGGGRGRGAAGAPGAAPAEGRGPGGRGPGGPHQIVEIDLAKLFADVAAGTVKPAANYQRVCGTIPATLPADGNMGLDANDDFVYFRVGGPETAQLSEGQTLQKTMGPRNMGAGPSGLRSMNLTTGEIKFIVNVGFQIGHVQTNPWNPGEIVFCLGNRRQGATTHLDGRWPMEAACGRSIRKRRMSGSRTRRSSARTKWSLPCAKTAVSSPVHRAGTELWQRGDVGKADRCGSHQPPDAPDADCRTGSLVVGGPLGLARCRIGRRPWAASDDFKYEVWLYDRHNGETTMLAGPQNVGADHIHPTFNAEGTKIEVQSALISKDKRGLNICVVPLPKSVLDRTYSLKLAN